MHGTSCPKCGAASDGVSKTCGSCGAVSSPCRVHRTYLPHGSVDPIPTGVLLTRVRKKPKPQTCPN
ncbi:uncharacterized protein THITE_49533 [Thermothielavioides terrestris NRRL 8126]|uniref:Uncharacterized protein n=1 Tax=Thermothielavioides terrestris (strain ATCC 38088 / NRRL 8126) TaxID=578455 RepID=G2RFQ1_THETT|nr:uncharacterized protein THITE_49533 [Thermothielavioides terrestris NRRL 8126]AEO71655.1 hypothetical protein THITE_49533 [Thermothielavioides terrestris NRRL 8126]